MEGSHLFDVSDRLQKSQQALERSRAQLDATTGHMEVMNSSLRRWHQALSERLDDLDMPDSQK